MAQQGSTGSGQSPQVAALKVTRELPGHKPWRYWALWIAVGVAAYVALAGPIVLLRSATIGTTAPRSADYLSGALVEMAETRLLLHECATGGDVDRNEILERIDRLREHLPALQGIARGNGGGAARIADEVERSAFQVSIVLREEGAPVSEQCAEVLHITSGPLVGLLKSLREGTSQSLLVREQASESAILFARVSMGLCVLMAIAFATAVVALKMRRDSERRERQARQNTEAVLRSRDHFLGMVTHELLSPIQVILGCLEVMEARRTLDPRDPVWSRLKLAVRSMNGQVSDLVDFARLAAGRMELRQKRFKPRGLIEAVLEEQEGKLIDKGLDVQWDPDPSLEHTVVGDPKRIRQVLTNLYTNAIKYTNRGGITIEASAHGKALHFAVTDTGIGIPANQLQRIFEPYTRLSEDSAEGTGVGLSVVRSLVEAMGGSISVESRVGEGSTFRVVVPVAADSPDVAQTPRTHLPTVLVVEDQDDIRAIVCDALREEGFVVEGAGSFGEGRSAIAARNYGAIVIDLNLGDGSGMHLAEVARATYHNQRARLILMSANPIESHAVQELFDAVLPKPVSKTRLLQTVGRPPENDGGPARREPQADVAP